MLTLKIMKRENKPTLPDELKPVSISFKSAFVVTLAIHIFVVVLFFVPSLLAATRTESDKEFLQKEPVYVGVSEPTPTPTPLPAILTKGEVLKTESSDSWPKKPVTKNSTQQATKNKHKAVYVVKPGDTFYSIVKKYKLNFKSLQDINDIEDPSKLFVGQQLKFIK